MIFIFLITIVVYIISISWTWKSFGEMEKSQKILYIIIGLLITYFITFIIFQISKNQIQYQNEEFISKIRNTVVPVFSGINSIIILPQIAKNIEKVKEGNLSNSHLKNRMILGSIIILVLMFFEYGYMKDTQKGILNVYNTQKQTEYNTK